MITLDSIVILASAQISCDVADRKVVMETDKGLYYTLNPLASYVWDALKEPTNVQQLRDKIASEFDTTVQECEKDLIEYLNSLESHGLVSVQ